MQSIPSYPCSLWHPSLCQACSCWPAAALPQGKGAHWSAYHVSQSSVAFCCVHQPAALSFNGMQRYNETPGAGADAFVDFICGLAGTVDPVMSCLAQWEDMRHEALKRDGVPPNAPLCIFFDEVFAWKHIKLQLFPLTASVPK